MVTHYCDGCSRDISDEFDYKRINGKDYCIRCQNNDNKEKAKKVIEQIEGLLDELYLIDKGASLIISTSCDSARRYLKDCL